jgi:hypothetical protein
MWCEKNSRGRVTIEGSTTVETETIVVHISPEIAAAYRDTSGDARRKLDSLVSLRVAESLKSVPFLRGMAETETIVVHVSPAVAAAYRDASGDALRKLERLVSLQLVELLKPGESLEDAPKKMSGDATAAVLTTETLDSMISGERMHVADSASIPVSLKIVAALFIFAGISCAIEIVVAVMHKHIDINFGVLGLFVGAGLLRLSRGWHTCALVCVWIELILIPIIAVFMLVAGSRDITVLGQKTGHASTGVGAGLVFAGFLLACWQYYVLTRPDIRSLFGLTADRR